MNYRWIGFCIILIFVIAFIAKNFLDYELKKQEIFYENKLAEEKRSVSELKTEISTLNAKLSFNQNIKTNSLKTIKKYPNGVKEITTTFSKDLSSSLIQEEEDKRFSKIFSIEDYFNKSNLQNLRMKEEVRTSKSNLNLFSGIYFPNIKEIKLDEFKLVSGIIYQNSIINYGSFATFNPNQNDLGFGFTAGLSF